MSMFQSKADGKAPAEEVPIHRIRITLTSRNVKSLEKGMYVSLNVLCTVNCHHQKKTLVISFEIFYRYNGNI